MLQASVVSSEKTSILKLYISLGCYEERNDLYKMQVLAHSKYLTNRWTLSPPFRHLFSDVSRFRLFVSGSKCLSAYNVLGTGN